MIMLNRFAVSHAIRRTKQNVQFYSVRNPGDIFLRNIPICTYDLHIRPCLIYISISENIKFNRKLFLEYYIKKKICYVLSMLP